MWIRGSGGIEGLIDKLESIGVWGAVTLGAQGVAHLGGRVPAFSVPVLDSTGAGDVLHGAFVLAIAQGYDELTALRFGVAAGSLRCKLGRVPYLPEVEDLLSA